MNCSFCLELIYDFCKWVFTMYLDLPLGANSTERDQHPDFGTREQHIREHAGEKYQLNHLSVLT